MDRTLRQDEGEMSLVSASLRGERHGMFHQEAAEVSFLSSVTVTLALGAMTVNEVALSLSALRRPL